MPRPTAVALVAIVAASLLPAADSSISGSLSDPAGKHVSHGRLRLKLTPQVLETESDPDGNFVFPTVPAGTYTLSATAPGFEPTTRTLNVTGGEARTVNVQFTRLASRTDKITVTADVAQMDFDHPDPAQLVNVRENILDANPGRPGAPVSIPGIPIETASGGLKAPQYFAPGVAGDHGEPIAQYLEVGSYLVPNNLSANAHGNGYSDPNIMIPPTIEAVETDGGAFNVREGNHSVNLAADYRFRSWMDPFVTLTGDYRDVDLTAGWAPSNSETRAWIAVQASYGNGFLQTLEHRQQYKLNGFRVFDIGRNQITLYGIGYYGESRIPGLVPVDVPDLHDTIDPRQRDQTHTGEIVLNDIWRLNPSSELQLSSFFRTYNLSLYSNFGDGLIRQSEFRTVTGGNVNYIRRLNQHVSIQAGLDYLHEAPRRLDLDRYLSTDPSIYGPFAKVSANNITLNFLTPYVALDGYLTTWLHYNLGWRRDQVDFNNADLLHPTNSFQKWVGFNSPKASLSLIAPERSILPTVSFSFGESFFTNDPRIGGGSTEGTPVSRAHAYQLVVSKTLAGIDFRVTLGRVTQEASLAKIDADTGLQFDEGPSRNSYLTASARRYFRNGFLQASFSKADARDLSDGTPVPEAPRLIFDVLGTLDRLPFHLHGRAEFEQVGRKPLGDGFVSVPVREFRGALSRRFGDRFQAGLNFLIATGYTGQTTEVFALSGEGEPLERAAGVYLPSYLSLSFSYQFGRSAHP